MLKARLQMEARFKVWTIGHGNRSIEETLELLKEHGIQVLVDVRRFPTSKVEHFKKEHLEELLCKREIEYVWLGNELGGYRQGGYKKHMRTKLFREGISRLIELAESRRVCIMCKEVDPKYCHRRFIAEYLERKNVEMVHITKKGQQTL
jgi:uncharacterized protein (DUF488 family)